MSTFRADQVFKLVFTAVLATALTVLVGGYTRDLAIDLGLNNPVFWLWAWFAWLGWIVVIVEVFHVNLDLGDRYDRAKPFEREGRLYRRLGVRQVKKFTVNGDYWNGLIRFVKPGYRVVQDEATAEQWLRLTRSKEAGHLLHMLLSVPALGYTLLQGWFESAICLLALDVLFDLYPIMIQRYNRFRLQRVLKAGPHKE